MGTMNGHTAATLLRHRRWLVPIVAFLGGVALGQGCSFRVERNVGYVCSPPCPRGQTCHKGTCVDVATSRCLAHQESLPPIELILRTGQ